MCFKKPPNFPSASPRHASLKPREIILLTVVVLSAVSLRLSFINDALWLDEAWVANSVLAPSIFETIYYDKWVQTTPPLLLFLLRITANCIGAYEVSLRMVPWLAGLLSVLTVILVLRRRFRFSLILLGTTVFATNYWALKYAQHVKQYSTDLLISCLFLAIVWEILESGRSRWLYLTLAGLGTIGAFLSFAALFWFPTAIIVVSLTPSNKEKNERPWHSNIWHRDSLLLVILYGLTFIALYFLVVHPNRDPSLLVQWENYYLGSRGFLQSLTKFSGTICDLLIPRRGGLAVVSYIFMSLCLAGILRAIIGSARSERRAFQLLLVLITPIVTSMIVSLIHQYPLLYYPRFIIWMLPSLVVLLIYSVESLWIKVEGFLQEKLSLRTVEIFIAVLCISYVLLSMWFLIKHPQSKEEVREAIKYLQNRMGVSDALFVHGANEQQFVYYTQLLNWSPSTVHMGATDWPCCSRNKNLRVSNPQAKTFSKDLHSFLLQARGTKVWLLLPATNDSRHWTKKLQKIIKDVPALMSREDCKEIEKKEFINALVYAYTCSEKNSETQ